MSEVAKVFQGLPKVFKKGAVKTARTFYFSLGDEEKWSVALSADKCTVTKGKTTEEADCFFKASAELFLEIWSGQRKAGVMDFMSGKIKSNNPNLLTEFLTAFGKQA